MTLALGIDTGGTYTDAVLVDQASGTVLAESKALTTRRDLSIGIVQAVRAVLVAGVAESGASPADIGLVGLSTTLATNAIVEGQGSPICLVLIGYDRELIEQWKFESRLVTRDVVYVGGGHDGEGNEVAALDEQAVCRAIAERCDRVEAFAVSGYFGVRNPAHELRVRQLVEQMTAQNSDSSSLPVTCAHELTSGLDSVRRATTAALNASLIPLLHELTATVYRSLDEMEIAAPLMIVKGDGSLVRAEWARRRPIETILSGPAASVVGAWHLAGRQDAWVVDVGGTTTDIAVLEEGRPRLNASGAQVGGWRTMIETVDVHTVGLGGDSHVRPNRAATGFDIGPRRAVPLCLLANEHPEIMAELRRQLTASQHEDLTGQFTLAQGRSSSSLEARSLELLSYLDAGPRSLVQLVEETSYGLLALRPLERLESERLALRAAFTPTDALHVLGHFKRWNAEAAQLGAQLLAARLDLTPETLCQQVVDAVSDRLTGALVDKILGDEAEVPTAESGLLTAALLERVQGKAVDSDLGCRLELRRPLVAIGAPVEAYLPRTAAQLNAELVVPVRAQVANALGAVVGGVVQRQQVLIRPGGENIFHVILSDGVRQVASVEEAVACAQTMVPERLKALSRQAGAEQVEVQMTRQDHSAPIGYGGDGQVFVETELTFTAVGRPGIGPV